MLEGLDYPTSRLTDGVVELRRWRYADIACIAAASSDPRIPAGTTVPAEYTEQRGREFIERQWARRDCGEGLSLAIVDASTGRAIGLVVLLHREDRSLVGLGYWVILQSRSKGFALRAVGLVTPWALSQPGVAQVEAIVEENNEPSLRVLRRAAFEHAGSALVDGRPGLRLVTRRR